MTRKATAGRLSVVLECLGFSSIIGLGVFRLTSYVRVLGLGLVLLIALGLTYIALRLLSTKPSSAGEASVHTYRWM